MKSYSLLISLFAAVAAIALTGSPALAGEATVEDLQAQIEALQQRIDQLELSGLAAPQQSGIPRPGPSGSDPFEELDRMQAEMNRLFRRAFRDPVFAGVGSGMFRNTLSFDDSFDVDETRDGYQITFDMHGYDRDKIDISVHAKTLTISGQQTAEKEKSGPEEFYQTQSFGSFMRTLQLPDDADTQNMKTTRNGDRLVINIPKKV